MCGSTGAQAQLQNEQLAAYQQAQEMTQEEYGHMQQIYSPMAQQFQSIFAMGPSQEGFSAAEKSNLESGVLEGTAQNYVKAAQAVGGQIAAAGGNMYMPSGAADTLRLQTALSSGQEKTREEQQIQQASYSQGYQQWQDASKGLETIASGYNPLGWQEASTSAGSAAANTANQIAQDQNSWVNAAIGAAGTALGGLASNPNLKV